MIEGECMQLTKLLHNCVIYTTAVVICEILIYSLYHYHYHVLLLQKINQSPFFSSSSLAEFKNERPQQKLIHGKPGKINCSAEGNPPPQFEWRKNDSLLLENDRFTQLSDGSLQIDTVRWDDRGVYQCSMKQTKGRDRITVYLQRIKVFVIGE